MHRQRIRRLAAGSTGATDRVETNLTQQRNVLHTRIRAWEQL